MEPLEGSWAPLQLKTAPKWSVGEFPVGAMSAAYGSFSILDDSAVHCCSRTETTSIHTLEASENGKLLVEWTWLGIFASSYSIFICSQISFASA